MSAVIEGLKIILDIKDWIPKIKRFIEKHPIAVNTFLPVLFCLILISLNHIFFQKIENNAIIIYINTIGNFDSIILFLGMLFIAIRSWRVQRSDPTIHISKKVNLFEEAFKLKDIGNIEVVQSTLWCLTETKVNFFDAIEEVVNNGHEVKIIIPSPNSEALKKLEEKRSNNDSTEKVEYRAYRSLGRLCAKINSMDEWKERVSILIYDAKTINDLPFIKAVMVDEKSIYLKQASYGKKNDNNILELLLNKNRINSHELYFYFAFGYLKRLKKKAFILPEDIRSEALRIHREDID